MPTHSSGFLDWVNSGWGRGGSGGQVPISLWVFYDGKIKYMLMVDVTAYLSIGTQGKQLQNWVFNVCFKMWFRKEPP